MNYGPTIVTERIRLLMDINNTNVSEVADAISVNVKTVRSWVNGKSEPNVLNMIKLACYFETHYDYITGKTVEIDPSDLPKSAKFIAVMDMVNGNFYSADCIYCAPSDKLVECYITSKFDRFLYVTNGKIRFQLPNYNYNKEN